MQTGAAILILLAAPIPAAGELHCTADRSTNRSTAEPVPPGYGIPRVPIAGLIRRDGQLTGTVAREHADGGTEMRYTIEAATGRFDATAIETRHDIGEEHVIHLSGTCHPAAPATPG